MVSTFEGPSIFSACIDIAYHVPDFYLGNTFAKIRPGSIELRVYDNLSCLVDVAPLALDLD